MEEQHRDATQTTIFTMAAEPFGTLRKTKGSLSVRNTPAQKKCHLVPQQAQLGPEQTLHTPGR